MSATEPEVKQGKGFVEKPVQNKQTHTHLQIYIIHKDNVYFISLNLLLQPTQ